MFLTTTMGLSYKKDSNHLTGRTENNRVVNFIADKSLIGQIVEVKITEALANSLRGNPTS